MCRETDKLVTVILFVIADLSSMTIFNIVAFVISGYAFYCLHYWHDVCKYVLAILYVEMENIPIVSMTPVKKKCPYDHPEWVAKRDMSRYCRSNSDICCHHSLKNHCFSSHVTSQTTTNTKELGWRLTSEVWVVVIYSQSGLIYLQTTSSELTSSWTIKILGEPDEEVIKICCHTNTYQVY